MPIMIDGKPLDEFSLREIVVAYASPERPFFVGGDRMDYTRNVDLLTMYGRSSVLDAEAIADRYHFGVATGAFTTHFNALRAGELIAWAISHRLVIQKADKWRLVQRERVFELCGPELKPRAVRVRGLEGAEAVVADKIWRRELKRRERAEAKRKGRLVEFGAELIDYIVEHAPDTKLSPALQRFAIAGNDTFGACRSLIVDEMQSSTIADANVICSAVQEIKKGVHQAVRLRAEVERQRERLEEIEALDAIAAAFNGV